MQICKEIPRPTPGPNQEVLVRAICVRNPSGAQLQCWTKGLFNEVNPEFLRIMLGVLMLLAMALRLVSLLGEC